MKHFLFVLACILIAGCGAKEEKQTQVAAKKQLISVKDTALRNKTYKADHATARHLTRLAKSAPNVKDAAAIVVGPYAVVGIDVGDKLERSRVETVKYTVAEAFKNDPRGAKAVVVADPDTYARIKQMGYEIQKGRPVSGIMNELAAIVGRVMPQIPNDVLQNNRKSLPKQYDNQLNPQEKTELRKEQKKQSNYHLHD